MKIVVGERENQTFFFFQDFTAKIKNREPNQTRKVKIYSILNLTNNS